MFRVGGLVLAGSISGPEDLSAGDGWQALVHSRALITMGGGGPTLRPGLVGHLVGKSVIERCGAGHPSIGDRAHLGQVAGEPVGVDEAAHDIRVPGAAWDPRPPVCSSSGEPGITWTVPFISSTATSVPVDDLERDCLPA